MDVIENALVFLIIAVIGFLAVRRGVFHAEAAPAFAKFAAYASLPAYMFYAAVTQEGVRVDHIGWCALLSFALSAVFGLAGFCIGKIAHKNAFLYAGLWGIPELILFAVPMMVLLHELPILPYVAGVMLGTLPVRFAWSFAARKKGRQVGVLPWWAPVPACALLLLGLLVKALGVKLPIFFTDGSYYLGIFCMPLAIFACAIRFYSAIRQTRPDKRAAITVVLRSVLLPVAAFWLCRLFNAPTMVTLAVTLCFAMPYDGEDAWFGYGAAGGVVLIPLYTWLLGVL
jgi:predicted permease